MPHESMGRPAKGERAPRTPSSCSSTSHSSCGQRTKGHVVSSLMTSTSTFAPERGTYEFVSAPLTIGGQTFTTYLRHSRASASAPSANAGRYSKPDDEKRGGDEKCRSALAGTVRSRRINETATHIPTAQLANACTPEIRPPIRRGRVSIHRGNFATGIGRKRKGGIDAKAGVIPLWPHGSGK